MSYKKQELPTLHNHLGSQLMFLGGVDVARHYSFLSCIIWVLCLRPVYLMLPVSLDSPFLIAPSDFFNIYLWEKSFIFSSHFNLHNVQVNLSNLNLFGPTFNFGSCKAWFRQLSLYITQGEQISTVYFLIFITRSLKTHNPLYYIF